MNGYTVVNLKEIEDLAPRFGLSPGMEARFARVPLGLENSGISHFRIAPGFRQPFGHTHEQQEEVHVLVGGSGRAKLGHEIVKLGSWDAVRPTPKTATSSRYRTGRRTEALIAKRPVGIVAGASGIPRGGCNILRVREARGGMTGTGINVAAVLVGGGLGTLAGGRLPEGMRRTAMQAIGLVTVLIGVSNFLEQDNPLVPLVAVILGLIVGEALNIDGALKRFGDALERRFSKGESPVSRAFVTTSLLFCVGPLTILGSLEDGLSGDYSLLALKSALDFVAALSFASVLGWGVLLSAGTVLVVQGTLTLSAGFLEGVVTQDMIGATTATGGVLILGLGLVLLELKEVRVANMLPALVVAPALVVLAPLWPL